MNGQQIAPRRVQLAIQARGSLKEKRTSLLRPARAPSDQ